MKASISQSEWEVMRVAWAQNRVTNREIYEVLADKTEWKMSTVKTLVRRLCDKGFLRPEKGSREYTYRPLISQNQALATASQELFSQICNKEVGSVLIDFIKEAPMSQADLDQLQALVDEKKKTAPQEVACNCHRGQCQCQVGHGAC